MTATVSEQIPNKRTQTLSGIEANKKVAREYTEKVFNEHNPERAREFFAPQMKWHGGSLGTVEGAENVIGALGQILAALPDIHASEQDILAEGDTVAIRFVVEATHKGNFFGIPQTNRRVRWEAVDVFRFSNGKIVEEWAADDFLKFLMDLGVYAPPWTKMSQTTLNLAELMQSGDDAWNKGPNSPEWDTFRKMHTEDVTVYWPGGVPPTKGAHNHELEAIEFFKTFPDNHVMNRPYKILFTQGNHSCSVADFSGTMKGPMKMPDGRVIPPTNKSFHVELCSVITWNDKGQIIEERLLYDPVGFLKQIGLA